MTLNQELIRARCQEIEDFLERLGRIRSKTKEAFLNDRDAHDIVS